MHFPLPLKEDVLRESYYDESLTPPIWNIKAAASFLLSQTGPGINKFGLSN